MQNDSSSFKFSTNNAICLKRPFPSLNSIDSDNCSGITTTSLFRLLGNAVQNKYSISIICTGILMVSPFLYANSLGTDHPDVPDFSRLTILSRVSILLPIDTLSPLIKNGFLLSVAVNFRVARHNGCQLKFQS